MADERRRKPRSKRDEDAPAGGVPFSDRPVVVVKFADDVGLRDVEPAGDELERARIAPWADLSERYPGITLHPMLGEMSRDDVQKLVDRAVRNDPTYKPPNFFNFYYVDAPPEADLDALARELEKWPSVQTAYVDRPGPDPVVNAANDPRWPNQGYLDPAPAGINAEYAWTFVGGDGAGQRLIDLERGWTLNHEDLTAHGASLLHGTLLDTSRAHGSGVLGIACAADNTVGCVGITPHVANVDVVSFHGSTRQAAIMAALPNMVFGDILLLEAQVTGTNGLLVPIEAFDAEYEAIRLATALGVAVVEAGGNGDGVSVGADLNAYTNAAGRRIFDRTHADFRDSGAIVVTAATSAAPHTRLGFAPFGNRIDCYAWGQNINTCASDAMGATNLYTTTFNGTSGASPIVTGAGLAVQGIVQASRGYRYSPKQLRAILASTATGTPRAPAETRAIGVMPNLRAIIDTVLNVAPDVYIRDFIGDAGEPHTGAVSASPDVILQPNAVANPQASYGAGSGTENSSTLGSTVEFGQNNFIYVRVLNQGGSPATNVSVTVYWSQVATLVTPNMWTLVGTTTIPNVPVGSLLTVSPAITWPTAALPPNETHACLVALIGTTQDPAPERAAFLNWDNFVRFIRENNNVTWRNFNVVDSDPAVDPSAPKDYVGLPFVAPGAPDEARVFNLELIARLPEGARVFFEGPAYLVEQLRDRSPYLKGDDRTAVIPVAAQGREAFDPIVFPAKSEAACRLLVHIPEEHRRNGYEIAVKQVWEDLEVGRVTWRLAPDVRRPDGGAKEEPPAKGGAYRRRRGSDVWHFCTNCTSWPKRDYDERATKPRSGELCNQCLSKKRKGACRQTGS
ncbi:MAG TPA: S8 family serine peptidase [Actinomycetota bacterium]|nr:S8 family serine peptidase [Actinomycetota bacterium]